MRRLAALVLAAASVFAGSAAAAADPAALVDPLVGTGGDAGHTFPGAVVPFGMVQFSPVSAARATPGGYRYDDPTVRGFALTRLSGAGCANLGSIPIMPLRAAFHAVPVPGRAVLAYAGAGDAGPVPGRALAQVSRST